MKTKLFSLTLIILTTLSLSCGKIARTIISTDVQFYYSDSNDKDLLDPSNPNAYKREGIDVYYIINGVKTKQDNRLMQNPEAFNIDYDSELSRYLLNVFLNDKYNSDYFSTTLVDFGSQTDTIKAKWSVKDNYLKYEKVWYNSKLVVTGDTLPEHIFIRR